LNEEQKAYYEARANEYDEWWQRRGRYDLGPEGNLQWRAEIRRVEAAFDAVPVGASVLELAGGTGNWTLYLARRVERVHVLENSSSMIRLSRHRLQEAGLLHRVVYEQSDLFSWKPRDRYDSVFLGFWLSHLPSLLLDPFLRLMASALRPGGCMVILEGQPDARRPHHSKQGTSQLSDELELRTLNDGREFRIVKRCDDASDLSERLRHAGLNPMVGTSGEQFLYAFGFAPGRSEA
jgi:demethylmenaquinone methyltransferase/2-methoxy-6-polyprenyl-1,4-benzoquinol methylase